MRWQAPQPLNPSNKTFDSKKYGAAANDVVLVSFDYRINVFGTMNFAEIDSAFEDSGCLALKDQVAALQWIKENIAEFGGNPDNITIFGESARAVSIMLLTVAPAAKGIFDKAITQSGSLFFYNQPEKSAQLAEMFMQLSGAKNIGELMKKSADEIKNIYQKLSEIRGLSFMDFMPTCEGKFLPLNPGQELKDGAARGIKFLTGNVADEWCLWLQFDENFFQRLRNNPRACW